MEDRYKFRGFYKKTGFEDFEDFGVAEGWIYGAVAYGSKTPYIIGDILESTEEYINFEYWYPVTPETLGQCTGLKDKNGVLIYENDICKLKFIDGDKYIFLVKYDAEELRWYAENLHVEDTLDRHDMPLSSFNPSIYAEDIVETFEVIGNVHENQELLEVK